MKYTLPQAVQGLEPYQPIVGRYDVRLDANESYLQLEPLQAQAFSDRLQEIEFNRYPDPYANRLCEAFATYYGVNRDLVTAFNGSDELLSLLAAAFFSDGQKLAVFDQDFSMYRIYAEMFGTACEIIPKREDLTISVEDTLQYLEKHNISALLFSNPCNPTSLGLKREDVLRLIEGTEALIILDEAYMDFWDQSVIKLAGKYENLMVLRTCSKAIGLAAARIGFAVTTPKLTKVLRAVKSPYNVNAVSQAFGEILLTDERFLQEAAEEIIENRKQLQAELEELAAAAREIVRVYPSCTNFVYLETKDSRKIYEALQQRSIAVRLMGKHLRISTGNAHENRKLIRELKAILQEGSL